jgi:hypothetical protein
MVTSVADLRQMDVRETPFAHVMDDQFIAPDVYAQLRATFPECPPNTGPTGYSLYWGDEKYQRLLDEQPAWRALFETFHSQAFIDWGVRQFASAWKRDGCLVDLTKARYVPYREDRIDKERAAMRKVEHAPDELWVRMDIYQGRPGYLRETHTDWPRRVVSMLIYFCDQAAHGLAGGELFLHHSRWNPFARRVKVTPRENLMVAFPCSAKSHHSVTKIKSMMKPRDYLQVHISSSVDVWRR